MKRLTYGIFSENNLFGGINTFLKDFFLELMERKEVEAFLFIPKDNIDSKDSFYNSFLCKTNIILFESSGPFTDFIAIKRLLKIYKLEVVHTQAYRFNILFKINKLLGSKINHIVTIHGVYSFDDRSLMMRIRYWIDYKSSFLHNWTVAVSQSTKNIYSQKSKVKPNNISVIYNGVHLPTIQNGNCKEFNGALKIGFLGRLSIEKGIDWLCNIIETACVRQYNFNFIIGGSGTEIEKIEEIKDKYKSAIEFLGFVSDINSFLSKIDILIITSKTEGCPLVVLEGFSRGIPVLASNVGGVSELVKNGSNGYLVEYLDTEAFLNKLIFLDKNRGLINLLGMNGFKLVEKEFTIGNMTDEYLNIIKNSNYDFFY